MKKVIFFDGDGTLWYPKQTKRNKRPDWIYSDSPKPKNYLRFLTLAPSIIKILSKLKKQGKVLVALSTHPHGLKEANEHMAAKTKHLKVEHFFDSVLTARPDPLGKGRGMVSYLKKIKIPKSQALLIGDSYLFDYRAARFVGIDCLLITTTYMNSKGNRVQSRIKNLNELFSYLK
jgi:FMN phosphatase YigB (HAD superfamily)